MQDHLFYLIIGIIVTLPLSLIIFFIFKKLKPKWANYERRFVAIILGVALTPLILLGGLKGFIYAEDYHPKKAFTQESWRSNPHERYMIVDDLIDQEILIGLNTKEVEAILGKAYFLNDSTISYQTGTRSGAFFFLTCSLSIQLENDKVIKVEKNERAD